MHRRRIASSVFIGVLLATALPLKGIYIGVETRKVPVARLVANLERQLAATPKDGELHVKLARLYGMAYAANTEELPVTSGRTGTDEVWFGHEPNLVPYRPQPAPSQTRTGAAREYLQKAVSHYRSALELSPDSLLARLGYGWALEQSGDKASAIAAYRAVVARAWPKEQSTDVAQLGQRFFTLEAAEYLIPLLDSKADAQEIAELRSRISRLERVPRPVTPIAIPLRDQATPKGIVNLDARVRFDADGSGRHRLWTWISPDAGWLVYDTQGRGEITSALQLFGNVSFWLFWNDGYQALDALDDDGNGELRGAELRHLAIWHDRDADGISGAGEVRSLAQHGIAALSCRSTPGDGLLIAAKAERGVVLEDGRVRPTYDVILRPAWSVSSPDPD